MKKRFHADKSLKKQDLSSIIINIFKQESNSLLEEMKCRKLEVILVPAPDPHHEGHKIRQKINDNPEWYRKLYWKYHPNFRRDRTLKALRRITDLKDGNFGKRNYKYDSVMRELIYGFLSEGYHIDGHTIYPANKTVRRYFSKKSL